MIKECFCSWSGGKDSCFALYNAINLGYKPNILLTIHNQNINKSCSHHLPLEILQAQANALDIPLIHCATAWEKYEIDFTQELNKFKISYPDIQYGIFGDIDLVTHKNWEEMICKKSGYQAILPLWQYNREQLLEDFFNAGFRALIVAVNKNKLNKNFIGEELTSNLIKKFKEYNIDICGENGEYHTVVFAGPIFQNEIKIKINDKPYLNDNYWFGDFVL